MVGGLAPNATIAGFKAKPVRVGVALLTVRVAVEVALA
jgi:hypothetical protein